MEERRTTNRVWIFGYRETDLINPDAVLKVSLILGGVCVLLLGLWKVIPN